MNIVVLSENKYLVTAIGYVSCTDNIVNRRESTILFIDADTVSLPLDSLAIDVFVCRCFVFSKRNLIPLLHGVEFRFPVTYLPWNIEIKKLCICYIWLNII